jgi:thioredoxin reductase
MPHDVIVVGGSYAGLSAALQLARAHRGVLVIDEGLRRNRFASHAHGFLGRDGIDPAAIVAEARSQLVAYPTAGFLDGRVDAISREDARFQVSIGGETHVASRLVLATGIIDVLPEIAGLKERWGKSVFHCPYCHGYELDCGRVGVIATSAAAMHQALLLTDWGTVTVLVHGGFTPEPAEIEKLQARGAAIEPVAIAATSGTADAVLADGRVLPFAGLFIAPQHRLPDLVLTLGCGITDDGFGPFLATNPYKETTVPGIYACGDVARVSGSIALAVADGAIAGVGAHQSLIEGLV